MKPVHVRLAVDSTVRLAVSPAIHLAIDAAVRSVVDSTITLAISAAIGSVVTENKINPKVITNITDK